MTGEGNHLQGDAAEILFAEIAPALESAKRPLVLGIAGSQGSGKTTVARRLAARLAEQGWSTALLSIDDLYYDRAVPLPRVADSFGVPVSTLLRWIAEMDWPRRSAQVTPTDARRRPPSTTPKPAAPLPTKKKSSHARQSSSRTGWSQTWLNMAHVTLGR